jgi:rubrerythrin
MPELSIEDVLRKAIEKEIDSQNLYTELGQKMNEAAAKETFQKLTKQEKGHQQLLEQLLRGETGEGDLIRGHPVDFKITEHFEQSELSPNAELKDIFLVAAGREKAAHKLYLDLAQLHSSEEVKQLFNTLANQELQHKEKMEFFYTEVAFPQTDGG